MDRRIRVKCPECAASIELRVDMEELMDVTCPRCQHMFTAKVPPPVLEIVPLEVEPVEESPPVRFTRVVRPALTAAPPLENTWVPTTPSSGVSVATHLKAFLIATGSIISLGLLIVTAMMINSTLSEMEWSSSDPTEISPSSATDSLASSSGVTDLPIESSLPTSESAYASNSGSDTTNSVVDTTSPSTTNTAATATGSKADSGGIAEKIILLANQIAEATKDADNEFILDRTHPKLIQLAGGRSKMVEILNSALELMKTRGITIANFSVSKDVVLRQVDQKVFAILPTTLDLKYPNRIMRTDGFLLAVSEDAGKTFTFIDGAGAAKNRAVLKQVLPDLPEDLPLPAAGTPREVTQ